jgi:hypothetical protein
LSQDRGGNKMDKVNEEMPKAGKIAKITRGALQIAGSVPFVGGALSRLQEEHFKLLAQFLL